MSMRTALLLVSATAMAILFTGCTTAYRMNIHVMPEAQYGVYINDSLQAATSPSGKANVSTGSVPLLSEPLVEVKNDSLYGRLQLRSNDKPINLVNVSSFKVRSADFTHFYEISFAVTKKSESKFGMQPKADLGSLVDLPAIYREAPAQPSDWDTIIGENSEKHRLSFANSGILQAKKTASRGATTYFVGLGLQYLVITPLSFLVKPKDVGAAILLLALDAAASAIEITGATTANVGASMANDIAMQEYDLPSTSSPHWGLYKAGWGFIAVSSIVSVVSALSALSTMPSSSSDTAAKKVEPGVAITGLVLSLGADIFWTASCVNSVVYAHDVVKKAEKSKLSLQPLFDLKGNTGLRLSYRF